MIANKKEFYTGLAMMVGFIAVLIVIFLPVFKGNNGLEYLDALYNSISKGSAYYIPEVREANSAFAGKTVDLTLPMPSDRAAAQSAKLYEAAGARVKINGESLHVAGDLGRIIESCLDDADAMYGNDSETLQQKYGYSGKQVIYNWWSAFKLMDKGLKAGKQFKEAKMVALVEKKALECSYNYFGIEAKKIGGSMGVVTLSLVFYVVYTLWYGFAVMFMFEGWGLKLEH
ncbi:MAG: hypothetical protein LJE94_14705 [Deltaproteobacteria bacterium]|nr:hypothetical protein [Deltaproteobacteria bacterium]